MRNIRSICSILALFVVIAGFSSCARNLFYLDISAAGAPLISDNDAAGTTEITYTAQIYRVTAESSAAIKTGRSFEIELYVSLKYISQAEPDTVKNKYTELLVVGEDAGTELAFSYEGPGTEMQPGRYWLEYVWIDDEGYHLLESESAVYDR